MRKEKASAIPDKLALVIVHYDPHDETGYHKDRANVIVTCISSLQRFAPDLPLWIWCNGYAGYELDERLSGSGCEFYTVSPNIGKTNARTMALSALPDKTIVAVGDDDILYYPNWFEKQMEIFEHFPNVGAVTGYPCRVMFGWGTQNTMRWASDNGTVYMGRTIPDEWEREYALSVGEPYERYAKRVENYQDFFVDYKGKQAYLTSHHCQFITQAGRIKHLLRYDNDAMGDERPFDNILDDYGLLRLATMERLTRHIGNVIDDDLRKEIERLGL